MPRPGCSLHGRGNPTILWKGDSRRTSMDRARKGFDVVLGTQGIATRMVSTARTYVYYWSDFFQQDFSASVFHNIIDLFYFPHFHCSPEGRRCGSASSFLYLDRAPRLFEHHSNIILRISNKSKNDPGTLRAR